jgi:hypothetical protein
MIGRGGKSRLYAELARPRPDPAPVISATLSFNLIEASKADVI